VRICENRCAGNQRFKKTTKRHNRTSFFGIIYVCFRIMSLLTYHYFSLAAFTAVLVVIALSNWRTLRRLGSYPGPIHWPRVSVLVPARNEEANIEPCVRSLLAQEYPDLEVLVLNDHSTDRTGAILAEIAAADARLHVLSGQPLPEGWLGKHWACHQLGQAATGDLLLFTDADTRHGPHSVGFGVAAQQAEDADLVTAIPHEEVVTWAEKLAVPLVMQFGTFAFLPLALAYRLKSPTLSTAIGQYMLFRTEAYEAIGGYAAVRQAAVDDMSLGRLTVACHRRWRMADATRDVSCRMYQSPRQVFEGFSKNLFAGFDYRLLPCVIAWLWLSIVFVQPLLTVLSTLAGAQIAPPLLTFSAVQIVLALALFGLFYLRFELPLYLTFCYPLTVLMGAVLAFRSILLTLRGRSTWKGRTLLKPKVRLW
jgi:chlorobactene glucosyltransferase